MPGCDVKIAPFSLFFIVKNMSRYSLSWIVSLAYLLLSLREASTKSCTEIRREILRDADCGTLLNNIERGSVPEPEIFAMHRACASSDCRKNMDDYMQHKSCESSRERQLYTLACILDATKNQTCLYRFSSYSIVAMSLFTACSDVLDDDADCDGTTCQLNLEHYLSAHQFGCCFQEDTSIDGNINNYDGIDNLEKLYKVCDVQSPGRCLSVKGSAASVNKFMIHGSALLLLVTIGFPV